MTVSTEKKDALYFLTEQACCLAQATGMETGSFRVCRDAIEHIAGTDAVAAFDGRTGDVERDLTGLKDYDTEQYEGKRDDVRAAIIELVKISESEDTPAEKRGMLKEAADMIAGFYGMDGVLEPYPA